MIGYWHYKMPLPNHIILCSTSGFEKTSEPTIWRKELIYPDHFVKKTPDGKVEFELPVDETLMDHWVKVFQEMKAAGVEVPVPIEHTTDPESRRGTVVDLKKEFNKTRGENAVYAYIRFRDPKAEELAASTQVSLFCPPEFTDGKGKKYIRPIRHVALTDYPLVPDLGGFEKAIAASLIGTTRSLVLSCETSTQPTEDVSMSQISDLADRLGITYEPGSDDESIMQAIESAWNADVAEDDFEEEATNELEDMDPMGGDEDPMMDPMLGDEEPMMGDDPMFSDDEEDGQAFGEDDPMMVDEEEEEEAPAPMFSASAVTSVINARRIELGNLVKEQKITPAVRDKLVRKYANPRAVNFALSHSKADADYADLISTLAMNGKVFSLGERTGPQFDPSKLESSPLIVDAQRRADQAKKKK